MADDIMSFLPDGAEQLVIFLPPCAHDGKGGAHAFILEHLKNCLSLILAKGRVKGQADFLFIRVHTTNRRSFSR